MVILCIFILAIIYYIHFKPLLHELRHLDSLNAEMRIKIQKTELDKKRRKKYLKKMAQLYPAKSDEPISMETLLSKIDKSSTNLIAYKNNENQFEISLSGKFIILILFLKQLGHINPILQIKTIIIKKLSDNNSSIELKIILEKNHF